MIKREILCETDYIHIPIIPNLPRDSRNELQIWVNGELFLSPKLALTDEGGSFFFLDVKKFKGNVITFLVPKPNNITDKSLSRICSGEDCTPDNPLYSDLYKEALRPAFHFSSRRGWLNDPNGLVYKDGIYHMYYQHNPFGTPHGDVNISWGHAISTDLLHWKEKNDAIRPWRRDWFIASGSAVVDYENRAGYGKDAIIAAFTVLGTSNVDTLKSGYPSGGQFLAASLDDGETFFRFSHEPTVQTFQGKGWRDPRLFRYEEHYVMAVYETNESDSNCVSFYVSDDFHKWRKTSSNSDLYECPDIFKLQIEGEEESKWVLYGADGLARIGDFDGYHFIESGLKNPLDYGNATYAGQTWSHHPEKKVVHTSWVRGMGGEGEDLGFEDMAFSQCMTIPAEITLRRFKDGLRVCRAPITEVETLANNLLHKEIIKNEAESVLHHSNPAYYKISLSDIKENIDIRSGKHTIRYSPKNGVISFENACTVKLNKSNLHFSVLVDTTTVEFCFENSIMVTYTMPPQDINLIVKGESVITYDCYKVDNIWFPKEK
ncbi:MAG: glycoside hydrolase family 32 protein [Lachnospirales bacterium]